MIMNTHKEIFEWYLYWIREVKASLSWSNYINKFVEFPEIHAHKPAEHSVSVNSSSLNKMLEYAPLFLRWLIQVRSGPLGGGI